MRSISKKSLLMMATLLLTTLNAKNGDIYVGLDGDGASAKYDLTDTLTAQGIVGFWGYSGMTSFTGRGIYKFQTKDYYSLYGYGSVSSWSWSGYGYDETVFGFGAGVGAEYDLRGIKSDFIPLFVSIDIGLQVAKFDHFGGFAGSALGVGVHYKF